MPCSDSSSGMNIIFDDNDKFIDYQFAKITCGQEIDGEIGLKNYLKGKTAEQILHEPFSLILAHIPPQTEESNFILYLEWDALRSAIAQFYGLEHPEVDTDRCLVTSVETYEDKVEVALVMLPPKEMPTKITSCTQRAAQQKVI